jgi:hypothetical protein
MGYCSGGAVMGGQLTPALLPTHTRYCCCCCCCPSPRAGRPALEGVREGRCGRRGVGRSRIEPCIAGGYTQGSAAEWAGTLLRGLGVTPTAPSLSPCLLRALAQVATLKRQLADAQAAAQAAGAQDAQSDVKALKAELDAVRRSHAAHTLELARARSELESSRVALAAREDRIRTLEANLARAEEEAAGGSKSSAALQAGPGRRYRQ